MRVLKAYVNWIAGMRSNGVCLHVEAIEKALSQLRGSLVYPDLQSIGDDSTAVGRAIVNGDTILVEFFDSADADYALKHSRLSLQVAAMGWEDNECGKRIMKNYLVATRAYLAPRQGIHWEFDEIQLLQETPAEPSITFTSTGGDTQWIATKQPELPETIYAYKVGLEAEV